MARKVNSVTSIEALSDAQKAEIEQRYTAGATLFQVSAAMPGISFPVFGKWIQHQKLTKPSSYYAKRSPWQLLTRVALDSMPSKRRGKDRG